MSSLQNPTPIINSAAAELAAAEAAYLEAQARYRAAVPPGTVPRIWIPDEQPAPGLAIPWDRLEAEILELYGPTMRSPATRRGMVHALGEVRKMGVKTTADLTVSLIGRLVSSRDPALSPNTVRGLLRYVQCVANFAFKSGYLKTSPFHIRGLRSWVKPSKPVNKKHQTREQIGRILAVLQSDVDTRNGWSLWRARRLQSLVATAAYTGLRRGEMLWMQVEDIDLEARCIQVVSRASHHLKTDKAAQPVPIPAGLVPILRSWLEHRMDSPPEYDRPASPYVWPNSMRASCWTGGPTGYKPLDRLKAIGVRAGITEGLTFHSLRRSVSTHLEAAGCGQAMITRILRHTTSATTTAHYQKADLRNMLEAVEGLTY